MEKQNTVYTITIVITEFIFSSRVFLMK